MSEPKAQYRTLATEFLAAASNAKYVPHWLYCEKCGQRNDHSLHVSGSHEIYTCPKCGNSQMFRVS
jgi:predicted RNA-binding Zn-ribbon protein involved in translation (DUF1610 family)